MPNSFPAGIAGFKLYGFGGLLGSASCDDKEGIAVMAAADTPYEDRIQWNQGDHLNGGVSPLGRYATTRNEDGTYDVVFISRDRTESVGHRLTGREAYTKPVAHNKNLLGVTSGGGEPDPVKRRRPNAPVCPECHMTHNGECV